METVAKVFKEEKEHFTALKKYPDRKEGNNDTEKGVR